MDRKSVAACAAGVASGGAWDADESPRVGVAAERQLQHAECLSVCGAVGLGGSEWVVALAAGADDELHDAVLLVLSAVGGLGLEALVGVVVAGQDELCVGCLQRSPQWADGGVVTVQA